jgi:hypothetical protein
MSNRGFICMAVVSAVALAAVTSKPAEARSRGRAIGAAVGAAIIGGIILNELNKQQRQQRAAPERRFKPRESYTRDSERPSMRSAPETDDEDEDTDVAEVQRWLNDLGHDAGPSDGAMGDRTRRAISAFQRSINAPATGQLLPAERQLLSQQAELRIAERARASRDRQQQGDTLPPVARTENAAPTADAPPAAPTRDRAAPRQGGGLGSHLAILQQLQRVAEEPMANVNHAASIDISRTGDLRVVLQSVSDTSEPAKSKQDDMELVGTPQNMFTLVDAADDRVVHVAFHEPATRRHLILYTVSFNGSADARAWAERRQSEIDTLSGMAGKADDPYAELKQYRRRPVS